MTDELFRVVKENLLHERGCPGTDDECPCGVSEARAALSDIKGEVERLRGLHAHAHDAYVDSLLRENARFRADNERLTKERDAAVKALEFYADQDNYLEDEALNYGMYHWHQDGATHPSDIARAALPTPTEETP